MEKVWMKSGLGQISAIADVVGWDKVNEILETYWRKRAEERVLAIIESRGGPGNRTCIDLARAIVGNAASPMTYAPLELTPGRVHVRIPDCGEGEVIKVMGLAGKTFWPCTRCWREMQGQYVNPKMKCKAVKAICEGDDYCEFDWTLDD
ncbi:hypothetical protein ACFLUS_02410 [Chloroflexota bacterium]